MSDMNSEAFRVARNAIIDARNGDVCGGSHTGCMQDGEVCPDGTMDQWVDHGPECPTLRPVASATRGLTPQELADIDACDEDD